MLIALPAIATLVIGDLFTEAAQDDRQKPQSFPGQFLTEQQKYLPWH
jgi:hypothetical protein